MLGRVKQLKDDTNEATGLVTNNPIYKGVAAGATALENLTGGRNEDYHRQFNREADKILGGVKKIPVLGDAIGGVQKVAGALGGVFSNLFDGDNRATFRTQDGKELDAEDYNNAYEKAEAEYRRTGQPVHNVMGYRVDFSGSGLNEAHIGHKMYEFRQQRSRIAKDRLNFMRSGDRYQNSQVDGKPVFHYRDTDGRVHTITTDTPDYGQRVAETKTRLDRYHSRLEDENVIAQRKALIDRRNSRKFGHSQAGTFTWTD